MAAALLTHEKVELVNVPALSDVRVMAKVVNKLGAKVKLDGHRLTMKTDHIETVEAPYELVSKMRASFNVLGALLARCHEAKVPLPGGCSIGKRGVDLHVKGLQALGADINIEHGYVEAKATKLVGADILLDTPSVGATENIMLAAALAEGSTTISNAAQEPEIVDLANFLQNLGVDIHGAGATDIIIHGVKPNTLHGTSYHVMPDRIEAATYMIAAAATGGNVRLLEVIPQHINSVIQKLKEAGAIVDVSGPNILDVSAPQGRLQPLQIVTQPYPGFATDLQAPFMAMLSVADGVSMITETLYENRFRQVGELKRMGAQIQQEGNVAVVTGVTQLSGAQVEAHDLRAGAAMVIAGLMAEGQTDISNLHHIDRGYEDLVGKLKSVGASIERVSAEDGKTEAQPVETPL